MCSSNSNDYKKRLSSLEEAFSLPPTIKNIKKPVQRENFDGNDVHLADKRRVEIEDATPKIIAYQNAVSEYSNYNESNMKKTHDYVPTKEDQVELENNQQLEQYNMLFGASIITGVSIVVLLGMLLAKPRV